MENWSKLVRSKSYGKCVLPGGSTGERTLVCGISHGDAIFAVPVIPRLTPLSAGRAAILDRRTRKGADLIGDIVKG